IFQGFAISDWQGIDRITDPPHDKYSYSLQSGIIVGIDMNYREFIDTLTSLVEADIIPVSRIDNGVKQILRVKFMMGLFENPLSNPSLTKQISSRVKKCHFSFPNSFSVP
ncbi:hypothetical protein FXO38_25528, partial [Capsicum annuum]